jgi:hypothetical protein
MNMERSMPGNAITPEHREGAFPFDQLRVMSGSPVSIAFLVQPTINKPKMGYFPSAGWPKSNENISRFLLVHEIADLQICHLQKHSPSCLIVQNNRSRYDSNAI